MTLGERQQRPCRRQIVPQAFELLRQMPVVEDEPHIIFDDAQPLGCPVEGSVENANGGVVDHKFIYSPTNPPDQPSIAAAR